MAKIIAIANQKGGVGKTATATAIASGLSKKKYRVLIVDADPQCNTTDTFSAKIEDQATLYDLILKECSAIEAIQHIDNIDIIAGDPLLVKADRIFVDTGREYLLRESLDAISDLYDYIIIDTVPGLGVLLLNSLTAADSVIITMGADRDSLQGLSQLMDTIDSTRKYTNQNLTVMGLLITLYQSNTNLTKQVLKELPQIEKIFNVKTFHSKIRYTIKVKEARAARESIIDYAPHSTAGRDYINLIDEILEEA